MNENAAWNCLPCIVSKIHGYSSHLRFKSDKYRLNNLSLWQIGRAHV